MLTLIEIASCRTEPHVEPVDRDPGLITLFVLLASSTRRVLASAARQARAAHRRANEAALFSSSSAWPHHSR